MNPALRSSAAHVFVQSVAVPELSSDDAHHLFRVLRIRDREKVTVSDGQGAWRVTEVAGQSLRPLGDTMVEEAGPQLTIAAAIPKGDRAEWMVQKLTELGVAEIVLLHCDRSVVRWEGERAARQLARVRRVAQEAAMQSRRVWLPSVNGPVSSVSVLQLRDVVIAEPTGVEPGALTTTPSIVVIGPEGGFSPAELEPTLPRVRLGRQILRIETAALAAAASFLI